MSTPSCSAPIGVFDSGVGGLTVARAISERLPDESLLYLGDTARLPYGTKSAAVVERYAINCARKLVEGGAKAIVIACNTASAMALPALQATFSIPIIGVIGPSAELAARTSTGVVGVLGTLGTVRSGRYQDLLRAARPDLIILSQACPMFVPLAEENLVNHPAARLLAEDYLRPLRAAHVDTLILGCTHYPVLQTLIATITGPQVRVLNSAQAVAAHLAQDLKRRDLLSRNRLHSDRFWFTDDNSRFEEVGARFFGKDLSGVQQIDV